MKKYVDNYANARVSTDEPADLPFVGDARMAVEGIVT
jgi:hypothetical protein